MQGDAGVVKRWPPPRQTNHDGDEPAAGSSELSWQASRPGALWPPGHGDRENEGTISFRGAAMLSIAQTLDWGRTPCCVSVWPRASRSWRRPPWRIAKAIACRAKTTI